MLELCKKSEHTVIAVKQKIKKNIMINIYVSVIDICTKGGTPVTTLKRNNFCKILHNFKIKVRNAQIVYYMKIDAN